MGNAIYLSYGYDSKGLACIGKCTKIRETNQHFMCIVKKYPSSTITTFYPVKDDYVYSIRHTDECVVKV